MFPYPSGSRLHVGHGRNYILGDALYRRERMAGRRILNPMGWDAFGLPAENAAIASGVHPREYTLGNIARMKEQLKSLGPPLRLVEGARLLRSRATTAGTSGSSSGCGSAVSRTGRRRRSTGARAAGPCSPTSRSSTAAASAPDDLVEIRDLDAVVLPDHGLRGAAARGARRPRLAGTRQDDAAQLDRPVRGRRDLLPRRGARRADRPSSRRGPTRSTARRSSRSRPSTRPSRRSRGAVAASAAELEALHRARPARVAPRARGGGRREGGHRHRRRALEPRDGREPIPVWLANFVLPDYGTGAIMGVPAHDQRDFEFARKYGLPIRPVYRTGRRRARSGRDDGGDSARRRSLRARATGTGRPTARRRSAEAIDWIEAKGVGQGQRRVPPPRLADLAAAVLGHADSRRSTARRAASCPCPDADLPGAPARGRGVPRRRGQSRSSSPRRSSRRRCPKCGGPARRETDTMDTFVDSSWYYLRFLNPDGRPPDGRLASARAGWMPVDQYVGGIEHAILHLLYARFVCRVLKDLDLVDDRGAVRAPLQPGDDHEAQSRDRQDREDVEVAGKHRVARRAHRALRRRHGARSTRSSSGRRRRNRSGRRRGSSAPGASSSASTTSVAAASSPRRRRPSGGRRLAASPVRAPDDPAGDRGRRPVPLPHGRRGA